jgi:transposase InsO family protein
MVIHPQARTTPQLREEIKAQRDRKQVELARQYNVTTQTIRKWQQRDEFTDKSHRPHRLQTKLSEHQEMLVVELRKLLLLPLDDLLVIVREFIHPQASRSGIDRTLRRHGVSNLKAMLQENETDTQPKKKTFKDYAPGFVHIDVKYLPQMADECTRKYLFVAIDRATRWVYLEVLPDKSARQSKAFLKRLIKKAPFHINKILTDNGKEFTDRFIANGERKPTGQHPFDQVCQTHEIEHRLIKPRHPQTNGMVERFNGRIGDILATTHFDSSKDLKQTLLHYVKIYNHHIPQKNISHITPIQALKNWRKKEPGLFKKNIYDLSGLDRYPSPLE